MPFPYTEIIYGPIESSNHPPINCRDTALPCPYGELIILFVIHLLLPYVRLHKPQLKAQLFL
jgi:hypothetical protein